MKSDMRHLVRFAGEGGTVAISLDSSRGENGLSHPVKQLLLPMDGPLPRIRRMGGRFSWTTDVRSLVSSQGGHHHQERRAWRGRLFVEVVARSGDFLEQMNSNIASWVAEEMEILDGGGCMQHGAGHAKALEGQAMEVPAVFGF